MLERTMITIHNLFLFLSVVIFRIPPWRWPSAWRDIEAEHRAQVHRDLLALRLAGKIRVDEDGRLWLVDKDN